MSKNYLNGHMETQVLFLKVAFKSETVTSLQKPRSRTFDAVVFLVMNNKVYNSEFMWYKT